MTYLVESQLRHKGRENLFINFNPMLTRMVELVEKLKTNPELKTYSAVKEFRKTLQSIKVEAQTLRKQSLQAHKDSKKKE